MIELPAFVRLTSRALIAVSGPDWRGFLQGLITQDVETLAPGELRFAALLTPQGRVLYDMFVLGTDDGCLLDVESATRADLMQRLMLYRLRAKVVITAEEGAVFATWTADPGPGWIIDPRAPALGRRSYGIAVEATLTEHDYDVHRLSHGVPGPADWGHDKTYPIEANFDLLNGIDFQKGCFVGQETTSRMKRRGAIKSRMRTIEFGGDPPPAGAEVLAGDLRAGVITSGAGGLAMALMRLDRIGGPLETEGRPVFLFTCARELSDFPASSN